MAVKALASIDNYYDLRDYAQAEYNEAIKYCNNAQTVGLYLVALNLAKGYESSGAVSATSEGLSAVTNALYAARAAWKSAGCSKYDVVNGVSTGATTTDAPGDDKEDSVTGASMWGPLLLAGLGLLGIWYYTRKKGKGGARKRTSRTRTASSRRLTRGRR